MAKYNISFNDDRTISFDNTNLILAADYSSKPELRSLPAQFALPSVKSYAGYIEECPGLIKFDSGLMILQTSAHGVKFSDGTAYEPSEQDKEDIKKLWDFLNVKRDFSPVETNFPGIKLSTSNQYMEPVDLQKLAAIHDNNKDKFIMVSFMVISALREMDMRDRFPRVIAGNATRETAREIPDKKVWDLNNMAY